MDHNEAPAIAFTKVRINGHTVNITARSGATADDVADTVWALLDGCRKVYGSEDVHSYGVVQEGTVAYIKGTEDGSQPKASQIDDDDIVPEGGTVSGGTMVIRAVMLTTSKNNKTVYELYGDYKGKPSKYADFYVYETKIFQGTGISPADLQWDVRVNCSLIAHWKQGKPKTNKPGEYFKDLMSLEPLS